MGDFPVLRRALVPMLAWMKHEALPFWGTVGADHARGGFHERLDLQGHPILDVQKRLMVQGRQVYVYCHAGLLGWHSDARRLADRCVEYMVKSFYQRDGSPGWVHSLAPDGSIASAVRDTYGHAFALLGLAWYYRWTSDAQALKIIRPWRSWTKRWLATEGGISTPFRVPMQSVGRTHTCIYSKALSLCTRRLAT